MSDIAKAIENQIALTGQIDASMFSQHPELRVCIAGGPDSGKTTLARRCVGFFGGVMHTDDLIQSPLIKSLHPSKQWSEESRIVAHDWLTRLGPWLIEGVTVPRALRKWLESVYPTSDVSKPCDVVVWLTSHFPDAEAKPGHSAMLSGMRTVWEPIVPRLQKLGVEIVTVALPKMTKE